MAIQKKHGKGRLDKWYKLAKEKGYRARAAFKLIQLNRKYGFLEKSKVLIDLCAAPGSWCQVAAETMPQGSLIVGVDLAPIKTIPRTITFQSDITTPQCRATLRQHLKTWKADTVLHDGAPNVGTAWVQDAFSQAELVLQSLKLATEFLAPGGTFVTKVFRSKDYNPLMWVFNQLFSKVEATKPPSSRNVSAEIFVVCRGYKAPKRLDPRFLDPRSVFADQNDPTPNNEAKVFNPEIKKRKRDGYIEGDYTQYKEIAASQFIETTDPIAILGSMNKLTFKQPPNGDVALAALDKLPETTPEIRRLCEDFKVLGRKDFRLLLKWRLKAREIFGFATKKSKAEAEEQEEVAEVEPMDEELQIQEEMAAMKEKETSRRKRERRRDNERKQKEITRLQMNMTVPTEIGLEQQGPKGEGAMFKLKGVQEVDGVDKIARGRMATIMPVEPDSSSEDEGDESDDLGDNLEQQLDDMFELYQSQRMERDAKYRAKKARTDDPDGEWDGIKDEKNDDSEEIEEDSDSQYDSDEEVNQSHSILPRSKSGELSNKAALFFDQDIFKGIGGLEDEEADGSAIDLAADKELSLRQKANQKQTSSASSSETLVEDDGNVESQDEGSGFETEEEELEDTHQVSNNEDAEPSSGFEVVKSSLSDWDRQGEVGQDGKLNIDIITAEAMTLAQQIASGQKTRQDLEDENFNKYTLRDRDGMPEWFLDDEGKHSKPHRPITAAGAAALKEKLRVLNARPIKKVREAKDRKKFKAAQRMEKLRKKSALLAEDEAMSEKDKAQSIARLMSRAAKKKPKSKVSVVRAGGQNKGQGRPKGVKGRYKMVDARLKNDVRAEKRLARKKKR